MFDGRLKPPACLPNDSMTPPTGALEFVVPVTLTHFVHPPRHHRPIQGFGRVSRNVEAAAGAACGRVLEVRWGVWMASLPGLVHRGQTHRSPPCMQCVSPAISVLIDHPQNTHDTGIGSSGLGGAGRALGWIVGPRRRDALIERLLRRSTPAAAGTLPAHRPAAAAIRPNPTTTTTTHLQSTHTTPPPHATHHAGGGPTGGSGSGSAAAMANASMRAAAAQYINPAPKLSHQVTVVRLYRQSLKTLGAW